jgi:hypothetical protein
MKTVKFQLARPNRDKQESTEQVPLVMPDGIAERFQKHLAQKEVAATPRSRAARLAEIKKSL